MMSRMKSAALVACGAKSTQRRGPGIAVRSFRARGLLLLTGCASRPARSRSPATYVFTIRVRAATATPASVPPALVEGALGVVERSDRAGMARASCARWAPHRPR